MPIARGGLMGLPSTGHQDVLPAFPRPWPRRLSPGSSKALQAAAWTAPTGGLVLLSQDEARFSLIPTLRTTLGVKGHRPLVGNLDGHDVLYVFGALNLVTGRLTT